MSDDEQVVHERHRCARGQRHAVWSNVRVRAAAQNGGHPTSLAARLHSPDGEGQSAAAHLRARFCVWSRGYKLSLLSKQEPLCEIRQFLERKEGGQECGGVLHETVPAAAGTPILPNLTVVLNLRFFLPNVTVPSPHRPQRCARMLRSKNQLRHRPV